MLDFDVNVFNLVYSPITRLCVDHFWVNEVPSCIQKSLIIRRCAGMVACVYLQHYRELFRRVSVLHTHGQPDLKRCELLCEERTVLWTQAAEVTKILELLLC